MQLGLIATTVKHLSYYQSGLLVETSLQARSLIIQNKVEAVLH